MSRFIYVKSEPKLWTVGCYDKNGRWHPDSDHSSSEAAAQRVHYLNGGPTETEINRSQDRLARLFGFNEEDVT